jgi:NADH-quinone oxidoreductase subunit B
LEEGRIELGKLMADVDVTPAILTRRDEAVGRLERLVSKGLGWARKFSLFTYPYATACCGMEYMSVAASRYDIARFGAEFPRFSPRQADMLMVIGTINMKQAPILKRVYDQMCEPKWVVSFGVCASSGGFYDNYAVLQGIDRILPVDVYIPGCPPRPEQVLDGLVLLQEKIARGNYKLMDRTPEAPRPGTHDLLADMGRGVTLKHRET